MHVNNAAHKLNTRAQVLLKSFYLNRLFVWVQKIKNGNGGRHKRIVPRTVTQVIYINSVELCRGLNSSVKQHNSARSSLFITVL